MRTILAALILFPLPTLAQNVLDTLMADFNGDGLPDRADLVQDVEEDSATLNIFIGTETDDLHLVENAPALVWSGPAVAGQQPEMRVTDHGSLQVMAMNEAIGRNRWHEVLTIAHRDGIFKVAGYTYYWHDTVDHSNSGICDINLLTGKGELGLGIDHVKSAFTTDLRAMPVMEWPREIPAVCLAAMQ